MSKSEYVYSMIGFPCYNTGDDGSRKLPAKKNDSHQSIESFNSQRSSDKPGGKRGRDRRKPRRSHYLK